MVAVYRAAWRTLEENRWSYLRYAAFLVVADGFIALTDSWGTALLGVWLLVVLSIHRHMLLGERMSKGLAGARGSVLRFIGVSLLLSGLAGAASLSSLLALPPPSGEQEATVVVGVAVLAGFLAYLVILCLLGTALPAAAIGERAVLRAALRRAGRTWPGILGGLLAGPTLWFAVVVGAWAGLSRALALTDVVVIDNRLHLPGLPGAFVLTLAGLFTTTLAVAVLCRAYRKVTSSTNLADEVTSTAA